MSFNPRAAKVFVVFFGASASPALAGGYNLDHQNAAAMGAAFAGTQAEKADSGYAAYNPAAIAGIETGEFSASITGVFPSTSYSNANGLLLGAAPVAGISADDGVIETAFVPSFALAAPLTDRISVGVVANATFGFTTSYAVDSIARYQAQDSKLKVIEVTPMAAFEVTPSLRLGAGLRLQYLDLKLTSLIDAGGVAAASSIPGFAPGSDDLAASFDTTNLAVGYVLGAQADFAPNVHFGFSYSSKIGHELDGDAEFDLSSSVAAQVLNGAAGLFGADSFTSEISMPATAALGVRIEADENVALLASARRMFWSNFDVVTLTFNDGATPAETVTQNWDDTWLLSVGAEVALSKATKLRAGFMYDESPVNTQFATPRIPDSDRYWLAAGLSQDLGERVSMDVSAAYAFFSDLAVNLDGAAPENLFRGALTADFETEVFAASMRIRYKF